MKRTHGARRAFTLIELLVVIAIIAILAAILFPVFSTVRESARQGSTMSRMHDVYLGARQFYEDEGHYPSSLFGYAEVALQAPPYDPTLPIARPATTSDPLTNITPMDKSTGNFGTATSINKGYLFREQVKDFGTFINAENPASAKQTSKSFATTVVYPANLPTLDDGSSYAGAVVTWLGSASAPAGGCGVYGDSDLPFFSGTSYAGLAKVFYTIDSMDIGPKLFVNAGGKVDVVTDASGNPIYELHYSPDWTHERYDPTNKCDSYANGPITQQLKYKNPPTERTVLTYDTNHVAFGGSPNVIILLANGTARTVDAKKALFDPNNALPFFYH